MIGLFKAVVEWFSGAETKRIKAKNAMMEQQLVSAAAAPGAPAELVEQATMYFSGKPPSDSAIPKVKESSHGSC